MANELFEPNVVSDTFESDDWDKLLLFSIFGCTFMFYDDFLFFLSLSDSGSSFVLSCLITIESDSFSLDEIDSFSAFLLSFLLPESFEMMSSWDFRIFSWELFRASIFLWSSSDSFGFFSWETIIFGWSSMFTFDWINSFLTYLLSPWLCSGIISLLPSLFYSFFSIFSCFIFSWWNISSKRESYFFVNSFEYSFEVIFLIWTSPLFNEFFCLILDTALWVTCWGLTSSLFGAT